MWLSSCACFVYPEARNANLLNFEVKPSVQRGLLPTDHEDCSLSECGGGGVTSKKICFRNSNRKVHNIR